MDSTAAETKAPSVIFTPWNTSNLGFNPLRIVIVSKTVGSFTNTFDTLDNLKKRFNVNELNPKKQYRVNMYFAPSAYMIDAYRDGNSWTRGSHTGILRNEKGKWYVIHNFHGDIMKDPLNDLIGSNYNIGITSISSILRKHGGQLLPKCFQINSMTKRRFI